MASPPPPLFVYGTLREPRLLEAVLARPLTSLTLGPATANGYRAVVYPGRTYPALVVGPDSAADGVLVAGLTREDYAALDRFEGEEYERLPIAISVAAITVTTEVYWPLAVIASDAPGWSFVNWRAADREAMIRDALAAVKA